MSNANLMIYVNIDDIVLYANRCYQYSVNIMLIC